MNLIFRYGMFLTINKPTRVTKHTISAIDRIFTNTLIDIEFKPGIIESDISHYLLTFFS